MKRDPQLRELANDTVGTLLLTPELVRSAKDIVSIYDRIDWDTLKEAPCDIVHLRFQSAETVRVAACTL